MDLSRVTEISPVVSLILTAEVERCLYLKARSVWGSEPMSGDAQLVLSSMGFYDAIGAPVRPGEPRAVAAIRVRSGDASSPGAQSRLRDIARIATPVFQSEAFTNRTLGALNEALMNVQMHAYRSDLVDPADCIPGRWWCGGVASRDHRKLYLFYMDHGVGIPATARNIVGDGADQRRSLLRRLLGREAQVASDEEVIRAVVEERKSSTGLTHHGRGLDSMLRLIDRAGQGTLMIFSGNGFYAYKRTSTDDVFQGEQSLSFRFPGTLIMWEAVCTDGVGDDEAN
ncbi:MAG: hypothetical protein KF842_06695 [Caulobacter sp.]|nr:hypothetical protein [Caulobacter sp.]